MNRTHVKSRGKLLASAGGAMAAMLAANGLFVADAQAATTTVTPTTPPNATTAADAHDVINATLNNVAAVTASVTNTSGEIDQDVSLGTNTNFTVDGNDVLSSAIANNAVNSLDPSVSGNDDGDGAASSILEINSAVVSSTAGSNTIKIDLDNLGTVGLSASGNTIEANATVNNASNTISGDMPIGYAASTQGSSKITNTTPFLDAAGGLVASTVQESVGTSASAVASSNEITLDLISTGTQTLTSAPALDDNTIAASVKGNSSDSTIDIKSGAPSVFTGTAVLTNAQVNTADLSGTNSDSVIVATIDSSAGTNTLSGSLSVEGNTISSSASGNEALGNGVAGNRILIADQVSVDGLATTGASVNTAYNSLALTSTVGADLIIHNAEGNVGASGDRVVINATTSNASTGAAVEQMNKGAISVADNATTAAARGNTATSAFATGDNIASFAATVAVANEQTNTYANTTASVSGETFALVDPLANVEAPVNGTVAVSNNVFSATAYGNQVGQSADVEAVSLGFPVTSTTLTGGTGPVDGNVVASGSVLVTNIQSQYSSDVTASDDSDIYLQLQYNNANSGGTSNDKLTVNGNLQEAVAVGNSGANALSLATTVVDESTVTGAGAGLASVQIVADASKISATSASNTYADVREQHGSAVSLTDNLQRAVAYGGLVGNTVDVEAQVITIDTVANGVVASKVTYTAAATDGFVLDNTTRPTATAAFGLLNDQATSAAISATAGSSKSFSVSLGGTTADLEQGSSLTNDRNAVAAAVYGNDATNAAELSVGNLDTAPGTFGAVMNVTNAQTVTDDTTLTARATGDQTVYSFVGDKVANASISTSDNMVQALANGNVAESSVAVASTSIDTAATAGGGSASVTGGPTNFVIATDSAFTVNSAQSQDGSITASLLNNDVTPTSTASIYTSVANGTETTNTSSSIVSDGNKLIAGATANRAENGLDIEGNALATTGALTNFQTVNGSVSSLIGIAGTPNKGGVSINIAGNLVSDTVSVDDNSIAGSVTGNSAANALTVASTNDTGGSAYAASNAQVVGNKSATALSDYSVTNWQTVGTDPLTSTVYGTVAIDTVDASDITTSSLTVDGNTQSSRAIGNTGASTVDISATNLSAGSALLSYQTTKAAIGASSDLDVFAPVGMLGSSVSMSDNANVALAVANNAANSSSVSVTNADPSGGVNTNATIAQNTSAPAHDVSADHLLLNVQSTAVSTVTASAVTNIFNDDSAGANTDNISSSSVTIAGNSTSAEASANRAVNEMDLVAGASLDVSGAVDNGQLNQAAVAASATTSAGLSLQGTFNGVGNAAVLNSGISLGDNSTTALARGNVANNSLNATAGADYGAANANAASSSIGSDPTAVAATQDARLAVYNNQVNSGTVQASSTNASYLVALNGTVGTTALNATIGVVGNNVSAAGYGNTATNTLTLASLNTGMPTAALGNRQYNGASVTASVTTVTYGINSASGAITGSALGVTGNAVTATAVGNNAINTLGAN